MKHRHTFSFLVLSIIFFLFLTACGGAGNGEEDKGEQTGEGTYEGTVTFGDSQFDSLEIHNEIARTILEEGYDVKTDVKTGSSASVLLGLRRGDIDVFMEAWKISYAGALEEALDSGDITQVSINYDDNTQGLYVPKYVMEGDSERDIEPIAPDLKSVQQLPEYKDLFKDPTDPNKGRIIGAPSGYIADETLTKKMDTYELNETFNYSTPGSTPALVTTLQEAYRKGEPWVGYGWTPTWFAAEFDLVLLEEPEYTEECWNSDMGCAFPVDEVAIPVNSEFAEEAPEIIDFLSQYKTSTEITNEMLLHMGGNDATPKETAIWWLGNNDLWTDWVPEDVFEKVNKAIK